MKIYINQSELNDIEHGQIYMDFVDTNNLEGVAYHSSNDSDIMVISLDNNQFEQKRANTQFWKKIDKFHARGKGLIVLAYKRRDEKKYSFYRPWFVEHGVKGVSNTKGDILFAVGEFTKKFIIDSVANQKEVELKEHKPILNQYEAGMLLEKYVTANINRVFSCLIGEPVYSSKHNVINNHSLMLLII